MTSLKISNSVIWGIDFLSTNSDLIVCYDNDGKVSLFSTKSNKTIWVNEEASGDSIDSIKVSPNRDLVAFGGIKERLFVINAANGDSICSVHVGSWIWRVLFLSQKKIACGLGNGTVVIVCWQTQKIEKILEMGDETVFALAISPVNSDILLTGDGGGVLKQTTISSEKTVMAYEGHRNSVFDLKFLFCGSMFVSGSIDYTARLFALDQKQAIRVFKGHTDGVRSVSLIHDDELLIANSYDNTVKVWTIESGECVFTLDVEYFVGSVSKDERSLIVGGENGRVTLFSCSPPPATSLDRNLKLSSGFFLK